MSKFNLNACSYMRLLGLLQFVVQTTSGLWGFDDSVETLPEQFSYLPGEFRSATGKTEDRVRNRRKYFVVIVLCGHCPTRDEEVRLSEPGSVIAAGKPTLRRVELGNKYRRRLRRYRGLLPANPHLLPVMRSFVYPFERAMDRRRDGLRGGRGEGVSNLAVGGRLSSGDLPGVGKALNSRDHTNCEPRHSVEGKVPIWRRICDPETI